MIAFDTNTASTDKELRMAAQRAALKAIREQATDLAKAQNTAPVSPPEAPMPIPSGGTGMIFLRRDDRGWWVRFFGIPGLGSNELPIPGDGSIQMGSIKSITSLLDYLKVQHGNKLSGAWILIAP